MVNCSSSGRCSSAHFTSSDTAFDGFIKLEFEKFTQTVAKTVLKFLVLSDLIELICLRLQASLIPARRIEVIWHSEFPLVPYMTSLSIKCHTGQDS